MAEVRHGVDRLDEEIVRLIGERFRYMDAAARIKPERGAVRDEGRKAQVLANVARLRSTVFRRRSRPSFTSGWSRPRSPTNSAASTR
jgi:chorismate mutase